MRMPDSASASRANPAMVQPIEASVHMEASPGVRSSWRASRRKTEGEAFQHLEGFLVGLTPRRSPSYSPYRLEAFIIMSASANGGRTETPSSTVFPEGLGMSTELLREHARAIWDAAVAAVRPEPLMDAAIEE